MTVNPSESVKSFFEKVKEATERDDLSLQELIGALHKGTFNVSVDNPDQPIRDTGLAAGAVFRVWDGCDD